MKRIICVVLLSVVFCCSKSVSRVEPVAEGQAVVTVEDVIYQARAVLDSCLFELTEYERITLDINDSIRVIISKDHFVEEEVCWSLEDYTSQTITLLLAYSYLGGSVYTPLDGCFTLTKRTESNLIGAFDITMTGGVVDCILCPEALRRVSGTFNVHIPDPF